MSNWKMREVINVSRSGTDVKSLENNLFKRYEENGVVKLDKFPLSFRDTFGHQLMQGKCQDIHGDKQYNIMIEAYYRLGCQKTTKVELEGLFSSCPKENNGQNTTKINLSENIQNLAPLSTAFLNVEKLPVIPACTAALDETKETEHLPPSGQYLELEPIKDRHDLNSIGGSTQIAHPPQQIIYAPAAIGGKAGAKEDKNSEEYKEKRRKNNEAVKKSRRKAKDLEKEIRNTNQRLKNENAQLRRELAHLRQIIEKHRGSVQIIDRKF